MNRVAVIGCRAPKESTTANMTLYQSILRDVDDLVADLYPHSVIVSGGAEGVDSRAVAKAIDLGMRWREHLPDYAKYGDLAVYAQIEAIVLDCNHLYAFTSPWSDCDLQSVRLAKMHKVSHVVREYGLGWKPDVRQQVLRDIIEVAGRRAAWLGR